MFTRTDHDGFTLLEFYAPESSNALGLAAARTLATFEVDRPVVVRSKHQRIFCAGGNLSDHLRQSDADEGLAHNREISSLLDSFAAWPVPKLAIIEGDAIGGGVEWLARFDARFITPAAQLSFHQKRVGLTPGWGGGRAWAKVIGEARLRQLLLEARPISAPAALRLGLVDRVITPAAVDVEIRRWARDLSEPVDADVLRWSVEREAATFETLWWGNAHRAALSRWAKR